MKFLRGRRYRVLERSKFDNEKLIEGGEVGILIYEDRDMIRLLFYNNKKYYYMKGDVIPIEMFLEIGV